jgi:hypothetical protein
MLCQLSSLPRLRPDSKRTEIEHDLLRLILEVAVNGAHALFPGMSKIVNSRRDITGCVPVQHIWNKDPTYADTLQPDQLEIAQNRARILADVMDRETKRKAQSKKGPKLLDITDPTWGTEGIEGQGSEEQTQDDAEGAIPDQEQDGPVQDNRNAEPETERIQAHEETAYSDPAPHQDDFDDRQGNTDADNIDNVQHDNQDLPQRGSTHMHDHPRIHNTRNNGKSPRLPSPKPLPKPAKSNKRKRTGGKARGGKTAKKQKTAASISLHPDISETRRKNPRICPKFEVPAPDAPSVSSSPLL